MRKEIRKRPALSRGRKIAPGADTRDNHTKGGGFVTNGVLKVFGEGGSLCCPIVQKKVGGDRLVRKWKKS